MAGEPNFNNRPYGILEPARDAVPVTPGPDSLDVRGPCRALYIGVAGDVELVTFDNRTVTMTLPQGFAPIMCRNVNAGATTATNIFALY